MIYQVRIIYNKKTLFASSYCAEFFKFCGLFLAKFYRDSMKDEIKSDYYFDKCKEYLQKKQS